MTDPEQLLCQQLDHQALSLWRQVEQAARPSQHMLIFVINVGLREMKLQSQSEGLVMEMHSEVESVIAATLFGVRVAVYHSLNVYPFLSTLYQEILFQRRTGHFYLHCPSYADSAITRISPYTRNCLIAAQHCNRPKHTIFTLNRFMMRTRQQQTDDSGTEKHHTTKAHEPKEMLKVTAASNEFQLLTFRAVFERCAPRFEYRPRRLLGG